MTDLHLRNGRHYFAPPEIVSVALCSGWYRAILETKAVVSYFSELEKGIAGWPKMPRQISFDLVISADDKVTARIGFTAYRVTYDSTFIWPEPNDSAAVRIRVTRERLGGKPACSIVEMQREDARLITEVGVANA